MSHVRHRISEIASSYLGFHFRHRTRDRVLIGLQGRHAEVVLPATQADATDEVLDHSPELDVDDAVEDDIDREVDQQQTVGHFIGRQEYSIGRQVVCVCSGDLVLDEREDFRWSNQGDEEDDEGDERGGDVVVWILGAVVGSVQLLHGVGLSKSPDQAHVAYDQHNQRTENGDRRPCHVVCKLERLVSIQISGYFLCIETTAVVRFRSHRKLQLFAGEERRVVV